jgi:hypothetical protein
MTSSILADVSPAATMAADIPAPQDEISVSTALLIVLSFIILWCAGALLELKKRVEILETKKKNPAVSLTEAATEKEVPSEVMAAISAAVFTTCGQHAHIVHLARIDPRLNMDWSHEGRRNIFRSHILR